MAKNWMAYEAAEVLLKGTDLEGIAEIGSRFPLFTVAVMRDGTEVLCDILKAVPKVTARVVETGLKESCEDSEQLAVEEEPEEAPVKKAKAPAKKTKEEEETDTDDDDYESMTSKDLYALCCKRGLSSKCKKRDKASLIAVLKADAEEAEAEEVEDDWEDEEEEQPKKKVVKDPYAGKTARELYVMCKERGIKAQPKKEAAEYAKLLKKADAEEAEAEEDTDDDDWEI